MSLFGTSDRALVALLLAGGRDCHIRRAGGTLFSILVHILLIWMLLNKLAGGLEGAGEGRGAGSGTMMLLDLSDPASAAASQADARTTQQRRVTTPVVSEVDTTASTELPPPE
jgi:hypothetical protein